MAELTGGPQSSGASGGSRASAVSAGREAGADVESVRSAGGADRTRIKFCGMTREEDVDAAVGLGVDAVGFIFYEKSPRAVTIERAAALARRLPPFVTAVGLFVNTDEDTVAKAADAVRLSLLQFHGDETPDRCAALSKAARLPWIRAIRIGASTLTADLLKYPSLYAAATGLVLDALADGYGGGGKVFDWSCIPKELGHQVVLGGGLDERNVGDAVRRVRPYAVDVSSGIEAAGAAQVKGVKDATRMAAFVQAVRGADRND